MTYFYHILLYTMCPIVFSDHLVYKYFVRIEFDRHTWSLVFTRKLFICLLWRHSIGFYFGIQNAGRKCKAENKIHKRLSFFLAVTIMYSNRFVEWRDGFFFLSFAPNRICMCYIHFETIALPSLCVRVAFNLGLTYEWCHRNVLWNGKYVKITSCFIGKSTKYVPKFHIFQMTKKINRQGNSDTS